MELFCTVKTAVDNGDAVECSAFILRNYQLKPGSKVEQIRSAEVLAVWEVVEQTPRGIILKSERKAGSMEFGDELYTERPAPDPTPEPVPAPIKQKPIVQEKQPKDPIMTTTPKAVLVFAGKNWKLASPKKWVPMNLQLDGYASVGEINISGKLYTVFKVTQYGDMPDCFAAQEKESPEVQPS